jgi:hypothetical protein
MTTNSAGHSIHDKNPITIVIVSPRCPAVL